MTQTTPYELLFHVHIRVKSECVDAFRTATLDNQSNSRKEPGVVQFDLFQQKDDPTRFIIVEAYRAASDHASHRETAHYLRWRDAVNPMMAENRYAVHYNAVV